MSVDLTVQISPLVFSTISSQHQNSKATGYLLGLLNPDTNTLEIENSFQLISQSNEEKSSKSQMQSRVLEILSYYRKMNVDFDMVGFYTLTTEKDIHSEKFIASLFEYQKVNPNFVGLVYNVACGTNISSGFRAFQLKPNVLEYLNKISQNELKDLEYGCNSFHDANILTEIPLQIRSSNFANICCNQNQNSVKPIESIPNANNLSKNQSDPLKSASILIDDLNSRVLKQNSKIKSYVQQLNQRQVYLDKKSAENHRRMQKGEPIITITEDLDSIFGPLPMPARIENIISLASIKKQSKTISDSSVGVLEHKKIIKDWAKTVD